MAQARTTVVALCLVALMVAAVSLPAASAYGCYDDCYERCANGKEDSACTTMCNEACGAGAVAKAVGAVTAAGANTAASSLGATGDKSLDATFKKADAAYDATPAGAGSL